MVYVPGANGREKFPSKSVDVPTPGIPSTVTVAPIIGPPKSPSAMFPRTKPFSCAIKAVVNKLKTRKVKILDIVLTD